MSTSVIDSKLLQTIENVSDNVLADAMNSGNVEVKNLNVKNSLNVRASDDSYVQANFEALEGIDKDYDDIYQSMVSLRAGFGKGRLALYSTAGRFHPKLEIAIANSYNPDNDIPVYVRQYNKDYNGVRAEIALFDDNRNASFPNILTSKNLKSDNETRLSTVESTISSHLSIANNIFHLNAFKDKQISIVGDLWSCYSDWNKAVGFVGSPPPTLVTSVNNMWWHRLITKLNAKLCTVHAGYNHQMAAINTCSLGFNKAYDMVNRKYHTHYYDLDGTQVLMEETVKPDIVIIMVGLYDWLKNAPLGEVGWNVDNVFNPSIDYSDTTFSSYISAYKSYINGILHNCPLTQIYVVAQPAIPIPGNDRIPAINATDNPWSMQQAAEELRKMCKIFGCKFIDLNELGLYQCKELANAEIFKYADNSYCLLTENGNKLFSDYIYQEMMQKYICFKTYERVSL